MHNPGEHTEAEQLREKRLPCERCLENSPLKDPDALYILRSIDANSFENALNAVEQFLGHMVLTDDSPTFATAATWLTDALVAFHDMDADGDGKVDHEELRNWQGEKPEQQWLDCHFDALTRAGLVEADGKSLTLRSLANAREIFRGLAIIQRHRRDVTSISQSASGQLSLTSDAILRFVDGHGPLLEDDDRQALLSLAAYLRMWHRALPVEQMDDAAESSELFSPEKLWPKR